MGSRRIYDRAKKFFHWKYTNWALGIFWTGGVGMVSIAVALSGIADVAFDFAYVFFVVASIWTLGSWLTCNRLRRYDPRTWPKKESSRATSRGWCRFRVVQVGVSLICVALSVLAVWLTHYVQIKAEVFI